MANNRLATREKADAGAGLQIVACPACGAQLTFMRQADADIDARGFESYRFDCRECHTELAGIIDPADDALLLAKAAA